MNKVTKFVILVTVIAVAGFVIRYTPLSQYFTKEHILTFLESLRGEWWGPIVFIVIYSVGCVVAFPGSVLTLAGGAVFGTVRGTLYNAVASNLGASLAFFAARYLGRAGLTEEEAKKEYGEKNIQVFKFQFEDVDRAVIKGEGHGLIKLVCDKKNQILGAHLLGPNAGELLHELVLAMKARIPITQISQTIHVYPTLSQAVKRSCDLYYREKLFSGWFPKLAKRLIRLA